MCLAARAASAPATHCCERSLVPATSSPTRGSSPPSLAIVSLLGALSTASAQIAEAASSFVSALASLISVHSGPTAPVLAMADWFS